MKSPALSFRPQQKSRTMRIVSALVIFAGLTLAGCGAREFTHGNQLDPASLARIAPGKTRLAEVEALFGKPSAAGAFDSGKVYYITQHMEIKPGGRKQTITRKIVAFTYNADEVVTAVDIIDETSGRTVLHVSESTPIPGNTFGVIEQLFGTATRRNPSRQSDGP